MHLIVVNTREGNEWHYDTSNRRVYVGSSLEATKRLHPNPQYGHSRIRRFLVSISQNVRRLFKDDEIYNDLIINGIAGHHVLLEDDGRNFFVTNLIESAQTTLAEVALPSNAPRIWGHNQELRLNDDVVIFLSPLQKDITVRRSWWKRITSNLPSFLKFMLPIVIFAFAGWLLLGDPIGIVAPNLASATATTIATNSPISTPDLQVKAVNTTLIATLPVFVRQDGPAATAASRATAVAIATLTPATPVPTSTPRTIQASLQPLWSPSSIADVEGGLNLKFIPATGLETHNYWRLVKVIWLNQAASGGRHTIYIDVRDEQNNPLPEAHVIVRWGDGTCDSYMPKLADLRKIDKSNDLYFENYHIRCPMYSAGRAYSVKVDGDPSDMIEGLGLGTPTFRDQPIPTSFLLIFQRTQLKY